MKKPNLNHILPKGFTKQAKVEKKPTTWVDQMYQQFTGGTKNG